MWFIVNTDKFQEQKTKEFLEETYPGIIRQVYLPSAAPSIRMPMGENASV